MNGVKGNASFDIYVYSGQISSLWITICLGIEQNIGGCCFWRYSTRTYLTYMSIFHKALNVL